MSRSPKATEPTMDEILASIRKIIAEDPAGAAPAQPAPSRMPAAPGPARPGQPSPPAAGQRAKPPGGPAPQPAPERRRAADLEADLADLLGAMPMRNAGLPGTPAPGEGAADPKQAQRPPAKANGAAGPMFANTSPPPNAPALPQAHRPLSEALNRARSAERQPGGEPTSTVPQPLAPAVRDAEPSQRGRAVPPPPAFGEPRPTPGGDLAATVSAQPGPSGPPSSGSRPSAPELPKTPEQAAQTPAVGDPRGRQAETEPSPAGPAAAKVGAQTAPPQDAVSAAAAAVARKVAATMPATPMPSRPFGASRAAGTAGGDATRTLEDTVAELLRPMLRQWLEANMPRIVEKALRVEMADSASPPKPPGSGGEQSS